MKKAWVGDIYDGREKIIDGHRKTQTWTTHHRHTGPVDTGLDRIIDALDAPACKVTKEGRGFTLEHGGGVALFDAEPQGFYGVQIKTIEVEPVQFFLSNEGAVALLNLLYWEVANGKLKDGMEKIAEKVKREEEKCHETRTISR